MRIQHLVFKPLVIEKCDDGDMVRVSLCVTVRPVWGRAAAVEIQILWLHPSRPRHHNINPVSHFTLHLSQLQSSARFDLECPCLGSANQRPVSAWHQPITGAENRVFTELSAVLATSPLYRRRRNLGEVPCLYPHSIAKGRLMIRGIFVPQSPPVSGVQQSPMYSQTALVCVRLCAAAVCACALRVLSLGWSLRVQ